MLTPDPTLLDDITEAAEHIAANADRIPRHWRRQALLALERAERFIPLPDPPAATEVDPLAA